MKPAPLLLASLLVAVHHPADAAALRVSVQAGEFDRQGSIVSFNLPTTARDWQRLETESGSAVPFQADVDGKGWFVLEDLKAGATKSFRLTSGASAAEAVTAKKDGALVRLAANGKPVATYQTTPSEPPAGVPAHYRHGAYLHPVITPSGRLVTGDYPSDHRHQRGIFFAWTKTHFEGREPDFWNLGKGTEQVTAATEFAALDRTWSGPVHGGFASRHRFMDYLAPEPKAVLREQWVVTAYNVAASGGKAWLLDFVSTQECASTSPLKLPKYFYGGLGVRGQAAWDPVDAVSFLTSTGDDRKKGDASMANWVHMGGQVEGALAGLAVLIHPDNFRSPQPLRLNPKNPQLCVAPSATGDWEISPGKPYVSRYRFVISDGPADKAELDRLWNDYAKPPMVTAAME
ncbi:MAG: PmoA family protein [Verrucomicrobia bacterium]|nr:PmoA family protein [Verrucomicrobiota bacterium]